MTAVQSYSVRLGGVRCNCSLAAELFAHAVVVLEHHAVCGQVKLIVVQRVLAEAHALILVHDAAHLDNLALLQAELVLVADDLGRRHVLHLQHL